MREAPFPYFGGKKQVSGLIWQALGDVKHYIEPFFGSGAVLLARPGYEPGRHVETICDKDGYVCNVWRALQADPDGVARWCDWPVNHADLAARKMALIKNERRLLENLIADESWHDSVMAGYWIWAASCWIGAGLTSIGQIPHISDGGKGVHKLGQIPHISGGGNGVHKLGKIPHISDGGKGVQEPYNENIYAWFRELSERLRYVRVVCGDWTRVCGGNWQDSRGTTGMFFDPPYGVADRCKNIYHVESLTVTHDVREWARERGRLKSYRIVIAGYEEHGSLLSDGWTAQRYLANGGYANRGKQRGDNNRHRETLYFSPHCQAENKQPEEQTTLFEVGT